jgi:4-amino-4-deoxy-L-arabinose transferase-like glycosyltransferase
VPATPSQATASASGPRGIRLLVFVAAALALSFVGIGSHALWTPDEPRDAAIGKAMWRSGDYAVPRLNGQPFLEKPPLAWWAQSAAYRAFGASDMVSRIPSALFGAATLWVTFLIARKLGRDRAGWLAVGVLASFVEYADDMRKPIVDPPLVFMIAVSYLGFVLLLTEPSPRQARSFFRPRVGHWLIAIAAPCAFLAKAVVGIGLALGPPAVSLLALGLLAGRRARREPAVDDGTVSHHGFRESLRLLAPLAVIGIPLFALFVLPWVLALLHEGGWPLLRECLIANPVGRFFPTEAGKVYGHREPFWYYLLTGTTVFLPWTIALPALGRSLWKNSRLLVPRFLVLSPLVSVVILSIAASKRAVYLVPLLPALAVTVGLWLDGLGEPAEAATSSTARDRAKSWDRATALFLLLLGAVLPLLVWGLAAFASAGGIRSVPAGPLHAELTSGRLATWGAASFVMAFLLVGHFARHLKDRTTPTGPWLVVPFVLVVLLYQTVVKASIDPLKNPHDLTAAVSRLDPGSGPVFVYHPSETSAGIENFDLDRHVEPVDTPQALATLLDQRPRTRVVLTLADLQRLPPEMRGTLQLLYNEVGLKASPFVIATRRPSEAPPHPGVP